MDKRTASPPTSISISIGISIGNLTPVLNGLDKPASIRKIEIKARITVKPPNW